MPDKTLEDISSEHPRLLTVSLIQGIARKQLTLDEVIKENSLIETLSPRDRKFVLNLTLTVLRHYWGLDAIVQQFSKSVPHPAQIPLLMGLAQILILETPDHAAVNETVNLMRDLKHHRLTGFVNGVLRSVLRKKTLCKMTLSDAKKNTQPWLWDSWVGDYGRTTARRIAKAHFNKAPLDITPKALGDINQIKTEIKATFNAPQSLRLQEMKLSVPDLYGFDQGLWWVQDYAAHLPVALLGDLQGKHVLDLCAAPGGKTAQLADSNAQVTAVDISQQRLNRLKQNMQRLDLSVSIICQDILTWTPPQKTLFDFIILDAPCSATGTIRRHPDIPFVRNEKDIKALVTLQERMLECAWAWLKPQGTLLYITCSLLKKEGEGQIQRYLSKNTSAILHPFTKEDLPHLPQAITQEGYLRTLPFYQADSGGMDGFFAARLKKKGEQD